MRRRAFLAAFLPAAACLLFSQAVHAAPNDEQALKRLAELQESILTMRASFVQEKRTELLDKPFVTKGECAFGGAGRFLWDYEDGMKVVSDGVLILVHYKDTKEADLLPKSGFTGLPETFSLNDMAEHYSARLMEETKDGFTVSFLPRVKSRLIREMVVGLDRRGAPVSVKISEHSGDETVIVFSAVEINVELEEKSFSTEVPPDVKVRRRRGAGGR